MRVFTDILLPAGNTCPMLGHVQGSALTVLPAIQVQLSHLHNQHTGWKKGADMPPAWLETLFRMDTLRRTEEKNASI